MNTLIFEAWALIIVVALAFLRPAFLQNQLDRIECLWTKLARRKALSVIVMGLLAFISSWATSLLVRLPVPAVHDEFSYVLAGDTFAHGRLTNPTHPMWVHFESFHIIQQPSYASKYPPAQGLALGFGQALFGHQIVGVWLTMGIACASLTWMLQGWVSPPMALLGGLLALIRFGFLGFPGYPYGYWAQSYWGGAVATTGGALVFGAIRRLKEELRISLGLVLGVGLSVLANSRPYEGFLSALPVAVILISILNRNAITKVVLPVGSVLLLAAAGMAYYNFRVTGNPIKMPYQVHEETYSSVPLFFCSSPKPEPAIHHKVMRDFDAIWCRNTYLAHTSVAGFVSQSGNKLLGFWLFYIGMLLLPFVLTLPWLLRDSWARFAVITCCFTMSGMLLALGFTPHYAAPIAGLIFVVLLKGMKQLRSFAWYGKPVGLFMTRVIPFFCLISVIIPVSTKMGREDNHWSLQRQRMISQLEASGGLHLVIVRYSDRHNWHLEWVYNEADIDSAKVVWAREMGKEENSRLIRYFRDRQVWLLEADEPQPHLKEYPSLLPGDELTQTDPAFAKDKSSLSADEKSRRSFY